MGIATDSLLSDPSPMNSDCQAIKTFDLTTTVLSEFPWKARTDQIERLTSGVEADVEGENRGIPIEITISYSYATSMQPYDYLAPLRRTPVVRSTRTARQMDRLADGRLTPNKNALQTCMETAMDSLSDKISERFLVPRTFRRVVCARSRVE